MPRANPPPRTATPRLGPRRRRRRPASRRAMRQGGRRGQVSRAAARHADRHQGHHRRPRVGRPRPARRCAKTTSPRPTPRSWRRLRDAGAIVLGKTVTVEFACFDPSPSRNPWDRRRRPKAHARRIQQRLGRRGGRGHVPRGDRHADGRVARAAVDLLRRRHVQADVRPRRSRRRRPGELPFRPRRPDRATRGRPGTHARVPSPVPRFRPARRHRSPPPTPRQPSWNRRGWACSAGFSKTRPTSRSAN